ncbi:UDP-N-acetylglucosamine 2-epimerase [Luteimonas gilva]|uniref:UDP-N-acetylglucosamine 2-epimerase n=1 Tax=Luteimonas gilva TaxID=2572684 RepID=UPI0016792B0E|nr:UDP-N-acetylglucosamine 2-epimerase [Luteimonas gilva]
MTDAALIVLIGTKAQFIKTAPVLRELDVQKVPYRLVYTGQHSETFEALEACFGTRPPDEVLVPDTEAATKSALLGWSARFWRAVAARARSEEWRGCRIGVVHGDTMSTLFGAMATRYCGGRVAHIEAGLRSPKLMDPFPEEIIRRCVSRLSKLHFAPDSTAAANLAHVRGKVIDTGGNTLRDALRLALAAVEPGMSEGGIGGYGVVSIHRNENLSNAGDFDLLMGEVVRASAVMPLKFVLHPATRARLRTTGWMDRLRLNQGLELMERMNYPDFVRLLVGSSCLLTDGGSNQEEAAMLGLPTLLLRRATERPDGLGGNVVLSGLQPRIIRDFVENNAHRRWTLQAIGTDSPSAAIVRVLRSEMHASG